MKKELDLRLQHIPGSVWVKISRIDEMKGRWSAAARQNAQPSLNLLRAVQLASAAASLRIEGAKFEDKEIEAARHRMSLHSTGREIRVAMGYYDLLGTVFTSWERLQFNESAIRIFHKELLKYVEGDSERPSEYKQRENKVRAVDDNGRVLGVIFDTAAPARTAGEMKELVEWTVQSLANNTCHPLLVIGNFIVEFLCIHPFQEGNGPLSRVLTDLLLLQAGYTYVPCISQEKLIEANRPGYYLALCSSQKTFNTVVPWLDYFTGILIEQAEQAMDFLEQGSIENVLSEKQAAVWKLFQEGEVLTPGEIADRLSIARPTVNQVLTKLLKLEKIDRMGLGRAVRYKIK